MAISYYDDAIIDKLKKWIPDTNKLRVLGPDDTKKLFELKADDTNDSPVQFPFITLTRNRDLEITSNIKQLKSFDGLHIIAPNERNNRIPEKTALFNVIPVKTTYQLNIYTKYKHEGEEYIRNFLFKLINNPQIVVDIPYNNMGMKHTAHLRVLDTISDTSDIAQRLFPGQFYRWTIQMELQDGFLFNIPYKTNWTLSTVYTANELIVEPEFYSDPSVSEITTLFDDTDTKN
jgi:hypothetical protein